MSKNQELSAQKRSLQGKKVSLLRKQGILPANVYGDESGSVSLSVNLKQFVKLYDQVGDTGLFYLSVEGEKKSRPVMVSEAQLDPLFLKPVHVSFKQVSLSQKIKADVPVVTTGEFGVHDAVVVVAQDSIEVEALPTNIPENFTVDVSRFEEIGQSVTYNDLEYNRDEVVLMVDEEELGNPVVLVQEVKEEVEEEVPVPEGEEGEEGEETEDGEKKEGDSPAGEGDEAKKDGDKPSDEKKSSEEKSPKG